MCRCRARTPRVLLHRRKPSTPPGRFFASLDGSHRPARHQAGNPIRRRRMTLQELLQTARATLSRLGDRPLDTQSDGEAHALATGVVDLLGVDTVPCGFEA